jgi:uncharacterized protein DUF6893
MRTVGIFTSVVGAAAVAFALVVGIMAIPDIKRYLKIRSM